MQQQRQQQQRQQQRQQRQQQQRQQQRQQQQQQQRQQQRQQQQQQQRQQQRRCRPGCNQRRIPLESRARACTGATHQAAPCTCAPPAHLHQRHRLLVAQPVPQPVGGRDQERVARLQRQLCRLRLRRHSVGLEVGVAHRAGYLQARGAHAPAAGAHGGRAARGRHARALVRQVSRVVPRQLHRLRLGEPGEEGGGMSVRAEAGSGGATAQTQQQQPACMPALQGQHT